MAAVFPSAIKTFTTKVDGVDLNAALDVNALQDEVTAIETDLLLLAHDLKFTDATYDIGDTATTFRPRDFFLSRNATIGGTLLVTGVATFTALPVFSTALTVLGTVTTGIWNAGAVTSSGTITGVAGTFSGLLTSSATGVNGIIGAPANGSMQWAITNTVSGTGGYVFLPFTAGTALGEIAVYSQGFTTSGVDIAESLLIRARAAGGTSIVSSHASGPIRFYSGGTTEAARFTASRQFYVGETAAVINNSMVGFAFNNGAGSGVEIVETTNASDSEFVNFVANGVRAGTVSRVGTTAVVVYTTTSDKRLKTDLGLASDLSGLRALEIHDFTWKSDESGYKDRGVFAQDAYKVMQRGITPGKTDKDYWQASYSSYVPDLIVGYQQNYSRLDEHEARIAALEARIH